MDIYERLTPIFRDVFDNDNITVTPELNAEMVDEWDSLGHVRLMVAIENELKITLSTAEITGLKNVGELANVIEKKLG